MAHIEKLPSGSYRVRVYVGEDNGKKRFKTFTDKSKRRAEYMANMYLADHPVVSVRGTLLNTVRKYIDSRSPVLSPYTVRGYEVLYNSLSGYPYAMKQLHEIDSDGLQALVNEFASTHSPKTTRNFYGLITASLKQECIPPMLVRLPEKEHRDTHFPTDEEVKELVRLSKDTPLEIPILLAAFGPMREGEIGAASPEDLDGDTIHVHAALAAGTDGVLKRKAPKTSAGDRFIPLPHNVADRIRETGEITSLKPKQISDRFRNFAKKHGFDFRFHDLRHYCASRLHALGMPDAYIMQRGGWSSDNVLKEVYRHALDDQARRFNDRANDIFDSFI